MALKRKINQAAYDALSDALKFEYKKSKDDEFLLEVDDAADLINARDAEKREKETFKAENAALKTELNGIKASNSNWETMEASYKEQLVKKDTEIGTLNGTLTTERRDRHTSAAAAKIAARFTVPSVIAPLIAKRLDIDPRDPTKVVVLDATGKVSALTIDDLTKEFVDNAEFKPMVIAHKGSGSAANGLPVVPGKTTDNNQSPNLIAKMSPKEIVAARVAAKAEAGNATT